MGDPGFVAAIIGYAVSKSIELVIKTARHAINLRGRCQLLAEKLDKVLPRVRTIEEQLISREGRNEGPVQDWLASLKATADKANIAVHKCNTKSLWPPEMAKLSKELDKLHAEIDKLVEKDLDFSLHRETHERLSRMECNMAPMRRHSSPEILSASTSFNDYHTQAPTSFQPDVAPGHDHLYSSVGSQSLNYTAHNHHNMYNSVDPHSCHYTAQGCHRPAVQRIASLDVIHQTRFEAMRREEETRRRDLQQ